MGYWTTFPAKKASAIRRTLHRARAERIAASAAKGVPTDNREAQMVFHRLASDDFVAL